MSYTLTRWSGDPNNNPSVTQTTFDTVTEIMADVRANDGLSEDEFFEFVALRQFQRSNRGLAFYENE